MQLFLLFVFLHVAVFNVTVDGRSQRRLCQCELNTVKLPSLRDVVWLWVAQKWLQMEKAKKVTFPYSAAQMYLHITAWSALLFYPKNSPYAPAFATWPTPLSWNLSFHQAILPFIQNYFHTGAKNKWPSPKQAPNGWTWKIFGWGLLKAQSKPTQRKTVKQYFHLLSTNVPRYKSVF